MSDRWFARHRQEWISESIRVYGFINREHLMRKFGISVPQASADIGAFQKENPGALEYDAKSKKFARPSELEDIRQTRASFNDTIDALQAICDDDGCPGGRNRIEWIAERLACLRKIDGTEE